MHTYRDGGKDLLVLYGSSQIVSAEGVRLGAVSRIAEVCSAHGSVFHTLLKMPPSFGDLYKPVKGVQISKTIYLTLHDSFTPLFSTESTAFPTDHDVLAPWWCQWCQTLYLDLHLDLYIFYECTPKYFIRIIIFLRYFHLHCLFSRTRSCNLSLS